MAAPVIQFKRGSFANLPGLKAGEPGFTTDRYDFYIGLDGSAGENKFYGSHRYWSREDGSTALEFKLVDKDGNNSINLKSPDSLVGVTTYTLPATPVNGQVLITDGDGNLSWTNDIAAGITTFIVNNINISGIATVGNLFVTGVSTFVGDAEFQRRHHWPWFGHCCFLLWRRFWFNQRLWRDGRQRPLGQTPSS